MSKKILMTPEDINPLKSPPSYRGKSKAMGSFEATIL
jgi:hypothetical protein